MKKLALVALVPLLVAGWTVTNRSLVLVDVHEADGHHLVVPVPLALAQGALFFAPEEARFVEAPELAHYLPYAERAIDGLREAPDGVLVEVLERDEHVRIGKEGDALRIHVIDGRETRVDVELSFGSAMAVVRAYDDEDRGFRTSDLVGALRSMPRGEVVHVLDGADEVTIRMW